MSSPTILVCVVLSFFCSFQLASSVEQCYKLNNTDCSKCYSLLVSEAIDGNENMFNIQNTFFPPNKSSPSFVTVSYHFPNKDKPYVWFWSVAYFYMFHPLHVFQFTSLFFSDINLHSSEVNLTLPSNCSFAREEYFRLLTQRLKLYATRNSYTSPISDNYDSVSGTVVSLREWHDVNTQKSKYIFSNFIVFPVGTIALIVGAVIYFNNFAPNNLIGKIKETVDEGDEDKVLSIDWNLQNLFCMSFILALYILALSSAGIQFESETDKHVNPEVAEYYTFNVSSTTFSMRLIASLPIVTFLIDFLVCICMIGVAMCIFTKHNVTTTSWCWAIVISLVYCLVLIFAVAITIVSVVTSGEMATTARLLGISIFSTLLVYPSVLAIAFGTERIYTTVKACFNGTRRSNDSGAGDSGGHTREPTENNEDNQRRYFYSYSIIFPLSCVANHLNYIIIAFVHNLYHATSVAIAYGVVILFIYGMLQQLSHILGKKCDKYQVYIKLPVVIFLSGYVSVDIILYFFLPIENAFDDAANHFISIYQTVIVFFAAIAAYFLITRPHKSPFSLLSKAEFNNPVLFTGTDDRNSWKKAKDQERDVRIATELLKVIKKNC